jgi:hypothetical protein
MPSWVAPHVPIGQTETAPVPTKYVPFSTSVLRPMKSSQLCLFFGAGRTGDRGKASPAA